MSETSPKTSSVSEKLGEFIDQSKKEDITQKINTHPPGLTPKFETELMSGTGEFVTPPFKAEDTVSKEDILDLYGLDSEEWEITTLTVNSGMGWIRETEGEDAVSRAVHRYSGKFQSKTKIAEAQKPKWWPVVPPEIPAVKIDSGKPKSFNIGSAWESVFVMPDQQFGYRLFEDGTGDLHPIHSEDAIQLCYQIAQHANPTTIVNVGDVGDFEQFGKYSKSKNFALTVQATVNRMTEEFAIQKEMAEDVVFIAGNHDARIEKSIAENIQAAYGLTQGKLPTDEDDKLPVMSLRNLCRLDDLGVIYCGPYPNGAWNLPTGTMKFIHGTNVSSSGSTAANYVNKQTYQSVIFGHIHRVEMQGRTIETEFGHKNIFGASPGTLARSTGEVPSFHSADDDMGQPSGTLENWQQGCLLVHYKPGHKYSEHLEMITFRSHEDTLTAIAMGNVFEQI